MSFPIAHPIDASAIGIYRLDEPLSSDDALDATGNNRTFFESGSPPPALGVFGGARNFPGPFTSFGRNSAESQVFHVPRFTVSAWINRNEIAGTDIWSIDTSGGVTLRAQHFSIDGSKRLAFRLRMVSPPTNLDVLGSTILDPLTWYLATATFDGDTLRIFLNAVEEDSVSGGAGKTIDYSATFGSAKIGGTAGGSATWRGLMDDFAYYNEAKHVSWIQAVYNGTLFAPKPVIGPDQAVGLFVDFDRDLVADDFGGLVFDQSIVTRCYLRLQTRRGSFWRDASFGSRLHTIETLENARPRIQRFAEEALEPLIQSGEIVGVEIGRVEINPTTGGLFAHILVNVPRDRAIEIANLKLGG